MVVSGLLNKQVGGELGISEITVKAHRGQVMRKMKADSLPDLVTMAARLGLRSTRIHSRSALSPYTYRAQLPRRTRQVLQSGADVDFAAEWRLLYGAQVVDTGRRKDVRKTVNHFVHHRAQLTVYPRTHEIPVPIGGRIAVVEGRRPLRQRRRAPHLADDFHGSRAAE